MIKKIYLFIKEVIVRMIDNKLDTYVNAMTFRMILAIFPLIIVMIASLGFFNINVSKLMGSFLLTLPEEIRSITNNVLTEVFETKQVSIISTSAAIALFSASSGFMSLMDGMNTAFGRESKFNYLRTRVICMILVIVFVALILLSLGLLIFGDVIAGVLIEFNFGRYIPKAINAMFLLAIGVFIGVIFMVILHKVAIDKRIPLRVIFPGSFFTVGAWLIVSKVFNFYVNNFYRYSIVYGSIGAFFVFALWLNMLSYVILIGSQISAVLYDKNFMDRLKTLA